MVLKKMMMMPSNMMTENPWAGLSDGVGKRADSNGKYDFFWVSMFDGTPGLILQLTDDIKEVGPLPHLRLLGVFYRVIDGRKCYCITLSDQDHIDIFETLCRDIITAAELSGSLQGALASAVRRTLRWHQLLRGGKSGMSLEEQRGLVAELAFLRELTGQLDPVAAIEAWKGPESSAKDFELPDLFFEIKARRSASHPKICISSETQLMDINGARFFLRVQDVDTFMSADGQNLKQHVRLTEDLFKDDLQALDLWEQKLAASPYSEDAVDEMRRWKLGAVKTFEVREGFPRLIPPLPYGVEDVSYSIGLNECSAFETKVDLSSLLRGEYTDV